MLSPRLLPFLAHGCGRTLSCAVKRPALGDAAAFRLADHPHNRFDILVAAPRATPLTRGEQTWVDDGETAFVSAEDPLQLLQQQLDRQPFTPQPHDDLPFLGGALGLFGHDLGRRFERLPSHAQADIALPDMAVGSMTGR